MPWLTVWLRFMRCAQAGGPEASAWLAPAGLLPPVTARPPAAKLSRRLDAARRRGLMAVETTGFNDAGEAARAIGGGGAPGDSRAAPSGAGDHAARSTCTTCGERGTSGANSGNRQPCPDSGTGAKLRPAGDEAVGDAGAKDGQAEQRKRREDQGQRVADGGRVVKAVGELPEDRSGQCQRLRRGPGPSRRTRRHCPAPSRRGRRCGRTGRTAPGRSLPAWSA